MGNLDSQSAFLGEGGACVGEMQVVELWGGRPLGPPEDAGRLHDTHTKATPWTQDAQRVKSRRRTKEAQAGK